MLVAHQPNSILRNGSAKKPAATAFEQAKAMLKANPCGISFRLVWITPEIAKYILENLNHPDNRNKKPSKIAMMAADIIAKQFLLTHQGIAFSDSGWLVDGQNRLQAIIEAGIPVQMLVFFDVPSESIAVFDLGTVRSTVDAARLSGNHEIGGRHIATAKRMLNGFQHRCTVSNQQALAFCEKHAEAIDFAVRGLATCERGVTNAPVLAVIARAWYTNDRNRLTQFCLQLASGMVEDPKTDQAVVVLRNYLKGNRQYGGMATLMIYKKVERALQAFLNNEKLMRLYEASEELFPLPEETFCQTECQAE